MATVRVLVDVTVERPEGLNDEDAENQVADRIEAEVAKIANVTKAYVGMVQAD